MRIAFLCKRRYMGKDVILDRYARLYEMPRQLARLGHQVRGYCLDYHARSDGEWTHEVDAGSLAWESASLGTTKLPQLASYPLRVLRGLKAYRPDLLIGASDIPHVVMTAWLSRKLDIPYCVDLYDNFEGFGQARIPGFVSALRHATKHAALVTTTSEPLREFVLNTYSAHGTVIAMPSSVDLAVFHRGDRREARQRLGLPLDARLIGTAGGLYRDKGVEPIYAAWPQLASRMPDLQLVLAGPYREDFPPPGGDRVHYLGNLSHDRVADLFRALDVGIISVLDTPFGRYCFPQKAYEMLACGLPVAASNVGAMTELFSTTRELLFEPGSADGLTSALLTQLMRPIATDAQIMDWEALISAIEPEIRQILNNRAQ